MSGYRISWAPGLSVGPDPQGWAGTPGAAGTGSAWWLVIGALVLCIGLLSALHQVVLGAVQRGDLRRAHAAAQADATWRCNLLRGRVELASCRADLEVGHRSRWAPQPLDGAPPPSGVAQRQF